LISDYFPQEERSRAIAIYMMGVPLGVLFGFLIGGWLNELYGWRIAFISLGVPGLIMAVIVKMTIKEPVRGQYDSDATDNKQLPLLQTFRFLWAKQSYRYLVIAMSLTAFVGSGIGQWEAAYFIRNHKMTTGELGTWLSLMGGLAGAVGIYAGGALSQYFGGNNMASQIKLVMVATFFMIPSGIAVFVLADKYQALLSLGILNIAYFVHYGPGFSAVLSLAPNTMRAMASAMTMLIINLIGAGLGPQIIGLLSDALQQYYGEDGLRMALILSMFVIFPAVWYFHLSYKAMHNETDTNQPSDTKPA